MSLTKKINLIGYASGIGAAEPGSGDGPIVLAESPYLSDLNSQGIKLQWEKMLTLPKSNENSKLNLVTHLSTQLATTTCENAKNKQFFIVLGGDHSSAIGTWSGASHALKSQGEIGLIWIDAHMDSHTYETTPSENIHGMPLACLLGHGAPSLTHILNNEPKLNPKNVCMIGVRSFEKGEEELLKKLQVKIFFMDEVKQRGLDIVMQEAVKIVSANTVGFGLTIDLDSVDPSDAPGTGAAEPDGLLAKELYQALSKMANKSNLIGAEIAEFDPHLDREQKTEKLVSKMIEAIVKTNINTTNSNIQESFNCETKNAIV